MQSILFLMVGIALGFLIKGKITKNSTLKQAEELDEMRKEAQKALTERTEKRKEKILDFMKNESFHRKELQACGVTDLKNGITRVDVEKLFEVSGGTARKYLNELESENKIRQIGKSGRDVYYILNP